ncbi:MAG: hypothetical protein WBV82_28380 [Myxococcaceae bacterium]
MAEKHLTQHGTTTTGRAGPVTMPGEGRDFIGDVLVPGIVTGLIGGTLMMLVYGFFCLGKGDGFWAPFKEISSLIFRGAHLRDLGAGAALIGILIHYNVSIALATTWAAMLPRNLGDTQFGVTGLALFYASLVFVLMTLLIVPTTSPLFAHQMYGTIFWLCHLIWGAVIAFVPQVRRTHYQFKQRMPVFLRRPVTVY